jgi:hypothetical protein
MEQASCRRTRVISSRPSHTCLPRREARIRTRYSTYVFVLATEGDDGDPAEGEELPGGDAVGAPVAAVVALSGDVLLSGMVSFVRQRATRRCLCDEPERPAGVIASRSSWI